jgi:hypothetical protein
MLKNLFFLSFILCCYNLCIAKCSGDGINVYPKGETISQNSIIIIEGYANSQKIILDLNKKYKVYMKSGNHVVDMEILELNEGSFKLTQAILKPTDSFLIGEEYKLFIDSLPSSSGRIDKTWKITESSIVGIPEFKKLPKVSGKELTYLGCGPSVHVNFKSTVNSNEDCIVKTTLINKVTGISSVYYLPISNGKISIGHGMCSGAFELYKGMEYTVTFCLMDFSGNKGQITEEIAFTAPK